MPTLTDLPYEVIASILRDLGNIRFLPPALLACRHFYVSFGQFPGIALAIIRQQIEPALLPYSIAALDASRMPYPRVGSSIRSLLDTLHFDPAHLVVPLPSMPVNLMHKMGRTHDVINGLVTDFATDAWARISRARGQGESANPSIVLSPAEYSRFCRAFYRLEVFYQVFRSGPGTGPNAFATSVYPWFFAKYALWEVEQLGSVHEFLDRKLSQASIDVLAHDIEFGEAGIDYLSTGIDNFWKELWLSQGLDFLHALMVTSSHEVKKPLLASAFSKGFISFPEGVEEVLEVYAEHDYLRPIERYSDDQLKFLKPHRYTDDTDKGPFKAWRAGYTGAPPGAWVMLDTNACLRRHAYVFWDLNRLQAENLLGFVGPSDSPSPAQTAQAFEEMQESFKERSKIWRMGGSGYWTKGDTSRVVYREADNE